MTPILGWFYLERFQDCVKIVLFERFLFDEHIGDFLERRFMDFEYLLRSIVSMRQKVAYLDVDFRRNFFGIITAFPDVTAKEDLFFFVAER